VNEIVGGLPVNYGLHNIPGAKVLGYIYTHYSAFSDWLEDELRSIGLSSYKLVFTGHSLGGALAVHAATDMLLEGIRSASSMRIYTIGQPRVGNKEFNKALTD
jgi:predicted lipase